MGISRGHYQYAESRCPKDTFDKITEFWMTYGITPNQLLLKKITANDYIYATQKRIVKKVKVRIKVVH